MHQATPTLILSRSAIQRTVVHFGIDAVIDRLVGRLTEVLRHHDPTRSVTPARSGFSYATPRPGLVEWMPIHEVGRDVTIKVVGYHPENPAAYSIPTIVSTISAYDTTTGHLSCLMDGVLPTALRTAAATVVASRILARPDSSTLGLIGCGAQAVAHVHALCRFFPITRILFYDTDPAARGSLARRCAAFGTGARFVEAPVADVVTQSDILLTATSVDVGAGPLFGDLPHRPHLHVNAIGSDFPGKTELPLDLLHRAYVCPDFPDQARVEGECQRLAPEAIGDDITVLCRRPADYRHLQDRLTVYDSTGWSLQDQVVLRLLSELAAELGLGQYIEIENMRGDASNPYDFQPDAQAPTVRRPETQPHEYPA